MAKSKKKKDDVKIDKTEQPKAKPQPVVEPKIETLEFAQFGWCHELDPPFRYEKGYYKPKSQKEYDALKKYAN